MHRLSRPGWLVALALVAGAARADGGGPDKAARLDNSTPSDLRKQLVAIPELPPPDLAALNTLLRKQAARLELNGGTEPAFVPSALLTIRPDLATLPLRTGTASMRDPASARTLRALSVELRDVIDQATPKHLRGHPAPPPEVVEAALRNARKGKRPEWLRAEAIPALQQILMGEHDSLRMILVDLLADIPGRASTTALAQRAVFDTDRQIRLAAIKALRERPAEDYRPVLLRGLRHPWPLAADHAAEALVALGDKEAVPQLIVMLKAPDPAAPFAGRDGRLHVRELVRVRHTANCMVCHPMALTPANRMTSTAVPGAVPDLLIAYPGNQPTASTMQIVPGSTLKSAERQAYYHGGQTLRRNNITFVPLVVHADVTYLRQDFSAQLPPEGHTRTARYDFLVRTRKLPASTPAPRPKADYPQRDSVLFALRHLTGEDCGKETAAWLEKFPRAEFDAKAEQLAEELVRAPASRREAVLTKLKDARGVLYTEAIAYAIPHLAGQPQADARAALAERLTRMKPDTLRDKLKDDAPEVRRAAAKAVAMRGLKELLPDLQALAQDDDPDVAQEAAKAVAELK